MSGIKNGEENYSIRTNKTGRPFYVSNKDRDSKSLRFFFYKQQQIVMVNKQKIFQNKFLF